MKKILLSKFVESYNEVVSNMQERYFNDNVFCVCNYVNLQIKIEKLSEIINKSLELKTQNISSIYRYVLFTAYLIENYTNLQIDVDMYKTYDLLRSSGLLNKILSLVPENEINESKKFIDMILHDILYFKEENE